MYRPISTGGKCDKGNGKKVENLKRKERMRTDKEKI
jgi:hypothetical protein